MPAPTLEEQIAAVAGDARVVGLGESVHAMADFYELKDRVFRHLVGRHGFRVFALESGFAEGLLVDDWIAGRTDRSLDEVLQHGFTYNMGCCEEFAAQLTWMRDWNEHHADDPLTYAGTDLPGWLESDAAAVEVVRALLAAADPDAAQRFGTDPDRAELAGWMELREPRYAVQVGRRRAAVATRAAQIAFAFERFRSVAAAHGGESALVSAARDVVMAGTVLWLLGAHGSGARIVFGAHNGHLQRVHAWGGADATPAGGYLSHQLGAGYVPNATTYGRVANGNTDGGQAPDRLPDGVRADGFGPAADDTVDHAMAVSAAEGLPVVDLRRQPIAGTRMRLQAFSAPVDAASAFDALVHIDELHPFHPRAVDRPGG